MTLPNFLIVGAMKCGTTTLHGVLGQHPQVFLPSHKELHFFGHRYAKGVDWYAAQFTPSPWQTAVGEATPIYMFEPVQRLRMVTLLPDIKIVAIVRDPVARAYSHYWYNRARALESALTFEGAVELEQSGQPPKAHDHRKRTYLARGHYIDQLLPLEESYGRDRLHVMLMEDLLGNTEECLRSLLEFLEVDASMAPRLSLPHDNSFGKRRPKGLKRAEPGPASDALRAAYEALPEGRYPSIDEETRSTLGDLFSLSNDRLGQWLGRDLSHWA
jgi:Sulfotransferase domain